MIDPTAHIDPHWPHDAEDAAREQPSLPLDLGTAEERPRRTIESRMALANGVLTLSKSEIATLRRCARRYYFEYVRGRTPAAGSGMAAEWGTALHKGLEEYAAELQLAPKLGANWDAPSAGLAAARAATMPGTDANGRPFAPPADPYAKAALRAMLRAYAAVWGPGDAERYEVVAVELPFDLPVLTAEGRVSRGRREGARREGRIDAVVRERKRWGDLDSMQERVWLVEHKSTGKPPGDERWYVGIELDLQTSLYFDAARELGYDPAGVLYDVIRRPDFDEPKPPPKRNLDGSERKAASEVCSECQGQKTIKDTAPNREGDYDEHDCGACGATGRVSKQVAYTNPRHGEPASAYEERVYQLAITKPGDFFHRRALSFEPWQIAESREDVRAAALEIAWRTRFDLWPRSPDWQYTCAPKDRVCPWLDVCGRRASAEDDRLFPLKRKPAEACAHCGAPGSVCVDPYQEDVNQRTVETVLCEGCYRAYADDI